MKVKNIASFLIIAAVFSCFISVFSKSSAMNGTAKWYTKLVPSGCFGETDEGNMVVAIPDALSGLGWCGQTVTVSCQAQGDPCKSSESINVSVVERNYPSPAHNFIALSKDAFAQIANPDAGSIPIKFSFVDFSNINSVHF